MASANRAKVSTVRAAVSGIPGLFRWLPDDDLDVIYLLKRGLGQIANHSPEKITVVEKVTDDAMRPISRHPVGRRYRSIFGPNIDWRTDGFEGLIAKL